MKIKMLDARKTKQNRLMFLPNCAIVVRKNWVLLKIKNSTISLINLKWIKLLLTGDKCMPELHLKSRFTYIVCGPFTEHRERIQKLWKTGNLKHL